ncbi:hypothetical protein BASA81_011058 [Batrachochytrium salamandrivorans]|nr:hypothetical protein BASA81_011058 [Batrachochytrium salamandrivorans]
MTKNNSSNIVTTKRTTTTTVVTAPAKATVKSKATGAKVKSKTTGATPKQTRSVVKRTQSRAASAPSSVPLDSTSPGTPANASSLRLSVASSDGQVINIGMLASAFTQRTTSKKACGL